jgi:hypothetical protein
MFQKHGKHMKWLDLQPDLAARSIQLSCPKVHFVGTEPHEIRGLARPRHSYPSAYDEYTTALRIRGVTISTGLSPLFFKTSRFT